MTKFLFILMCFYFVSMFWPHSSEAAWGRGGCESCQAGQIQAEAPVVFQAPDDTRSVCTNCPGAPLRKAAAVVVAAPVAVVRRVAADGPARRWIRSRRGGCN